MKVKVSKIYENTLSFLTFHIELIELFIIISKVVNFRKIKNIPSV